ncbi:MAG TPA: hypothetical protein VFN10_07995 [Thermoanaerobaculia bacterium]|nr:hypothetical protein [Thermoanaerobaculia bacterium]
MPARTTILALLVCLIAATALPCAFPPPALLTPENGATGVDTAQAVFFDWEPVDGSNGYDLMASINGNAPVQLGNTTASDFETGVPAASEIEWWVVANFDGCEVGVESEHWTFSTFQCTSGEPPVLLAPGDGAENLSSPVSFSWSQTEGADGYRLWLIGTDAAGGVNVDVLEDTGTSTSTTATLEPGTYGWFVEAYFDHCESVLSDAFVFTIHQAENCSGEAAVPLSPVGGETVTSSPVTFTWQGVEGATSYELWASLDGGDYQYIDTTTDTAVDAWLGEGEVSWFIVTHFDGCDDTTSDTAEFVIPLNEECDNELPYPLLPAEGAEGLPPEVDFEWTPVDGATRYNVWISVDGHDAEVLGSTDADTTTLTATVPVGAIDWSVEVEFESCPSELSPTSSFTVADEGACRRPDAPDLFVDPSARSGIAYRLIWTPVAHAGSFEVQEATNLDFVGAKDYASEDATLELSHSVDQQTRYYYRVRALSDCNQPPGDYSVSGYVVVAPEKVAKPDDAEVSAPYGTQRVVVQKVHIDGSGVAGKTATATGFSATTDQPWLKVEPATGTIPPEGLDLTLTADPKQLPVGTNTATVQLATQLADAPKTYPVSINLVTPTTPNPGNAPIPQSLIIPAVAHVAGSGASFESDIRIANTAAQAIKYQLTFTPTRSDGTKVGQQSTLQVNAGDTVALNDILKNFFGFSADSDNVSGVLEIRPLSSGSGSSQSLPNVTFASSRTFAIGPQGTYGQYIPALPFSTFIGKDQTISLQQIAQSAQYRTNLGLVEAAGQPASVLVSVFGGNGTKLGDFPYDLRPGEHMQLGSFLAAKGLSVEDGRIEVKVLSSTGKVTAYASVLDNATADPLLVLPVEAQTVTSKRYVLPGIAYVNAWRSDVRLYNAGTTDVDAKVQFYSQSGGDPIEKSVKIGAGKVAALDNVLQTMFGAANGAGGSLLLTTDADAKLVATARTYNQTDNGTYGQFIPGVTAKDGVGLGERALQILQAEESERFRTNLGIVELTGNNVRVEVTARPPDSKVTAKIEVPLGPNQFVQLGSILRTMGLGTTYNARITMRVVNGNGRISGYGSLIDNRTQDPTYVPAQ